MVQGILRFLGGFGVLALTAISPSLQAQTVGLLREVWENLGGASVSDLTSSPNYPGRPTSSNYVTHLFEAPVDVLENYGQRMHGYVVPPITGNYTFWIATDDGGALHLSTDEDPARARLIARVNGWTSPREWTREANQKSAPIPLVAGQAYYISALMKEQGGGDNLAVRWLMPDGVDQAPIVGTNLLPWGVSFGPPTLARQPADTTVVEGGTALFEVQLGKVGPATFQWARNGVNLPGGTERQLRYGPVRFSDQGALFRVGITNQKGGVLSAEARLTVTPDTAPPTLVSVLNVGRTLLRVTFSEPLEVASATDPARYTVGGSTPVTVRSARIGASPEVVELTLDPMNYGATHRLAVEGVRDQARTPNAVPAGSSIAFTVFEYSPAAVGRPPALGGITSVTGGFDVVGAGTLGERGDDFQFAYQPVTGNFDRRVRLESLDPTDPFAQAGLMARATLESNALFAAAIATPSQVGSYFLARTAAGSAATRSGSQPPNYPQTWLRLSRSGNVFRAFAGWDGQSWTELGSATLSLPSTVLLGLAVGGRGSGVAAQARFREVGDVSGAVLVPSPVRRGETPGPSSRGTALAFSEIMVHPAGRPDGLEGEFVELHNTGLVEQDLTGWRISGSVDFDFPEGYRLPAGGYAVIARKPADLAVIHGITGVLGPFRGTNALPNGSGTLRLRNPQGAMLLEVNYDNRAPWPAAAAGAGHSLVLSHPSYGEGDARAWSASDSIGGTPGTLDTLRPNPQAAVLINEILAHTDLPQLDAIELYNHGNEPVDLGGCVLTDDASTNRFRIPPGTLLVPRGYLAFDENQLGFRLSAGGETVFLLSSNLTRVLDAVRFGAQENGVASGRFPDGTPEWRRLENPTFGAENAPFRVAEVVINEIMYAPISGDSDDEFVELHNRSAVPVDLGGWSFTEGIGFRFPQGTQLPQGGYLVVARNRDRLLSRYPGLAAGSVFGNFNGSLSGGGERLALARPDFLVVTNALGFAETNRIDIEIDEVTYGTGGAWGAWSDGGGSSLELIDPHSDHLRPSNWADSDESGKAPWTVVEFTGRVDNVADGVSSDRLHLLTQGAGEYLIDDVEVIGPGGTNRVTNGDFSAGITGWTAQGNHRASAIDATGGVGGSPALRIVAPGRGDTAVNRVRTPIRSALAVNNTATLRARVRWVRGWPEFLLRTRGSGLEAFAALSLPTNLGTPGARNSRAVANAGPALVDVTHSPVVPRASQSVTLSARATDPDGIGTVQVRYRIDPASSLTTVAMRDDGTGGDGVAGDGVYSATIPGRAAGTLVAFRVEATDRDASPATTVFPVGAPAREALIRWGEEKPFGNLGLYRFWQRTSDFNRLRSREPLANDNLDCTFVYGDERVIYNAGMRGKGSPWHGGSVGGDYLFAMPEDNRLLGDTDVAIVTLGNLGSDPSAQREQVAFWIGERIGVAGLHRRHALFFENGGFKGLYEDTQEPNGRYVDTRFPDGPDGELFKIEDWFEFEDGGSSFVFSRDATLERFATLGGSLKLARYRWAWRKRAVTRSANDYEDFFQLVQAVNGSGSTFVPRVSSLADIDGWMRDFALQHIVGNWDAYGSGRGKNSYLYLPTGGRWQIIPWDIDFVLGSGSEGPTADIFGANDPIVGKLWGTPEFRRMYWRAFQDAVNGPLRESEFLPLIEARHRSLAANGYNVEAPSGIREFINQRREYLRARIASEDVASLQITSNGGANFSTNRSLATVSGTAPIAVSTITVNGLPFPVVWNTVNTWSLSLPLGEATNVLQFIGLDARGRPVPGAADSVTIRFTGTPAAPEEFIVLNEIQYDPAVPGTGFVEIHNTAPSGAFDLSGWRLEGAGFVFPAGTLIRGGGFVVVAADLDAFRASYGSTVIPAGVFPGQLQNNGERLRLVKPGASPDLDRVIDEVRYGNEVPWPTQAHGLGPSLQLIDPRQDNRRVANWGAAATNAPTLATPGTVNSIASTLDVFPTLWLNEVQPGNLDGPLDAAGDRDPWVEIHNPGNDTVDLTGLFLASGYERLEEWPFPPGTTLGPKRFLVVWCDGEPGESTATELHAGFRLPATRGSVALVRRQLGSPAVIDHLDYRDLPARRAWGSYPDGDPFTRQLLHQPTPGAANNNAAPAVSVFINEWMAANNGAVPDPADGDPDDWFELFNAGTTAADLSAFTLTDDPARPDKFAIPPGTVIPPGGYLLVWADEEPGQSTNGTLHANFRLSGSGEFLGLFGPNGARVDALTFGAQVANRSQGRFPDGGAEPFPELDLPSPGRPNILGNANQPPVLRPPGNYAVLEGLQVQFQASASDPDAGQSLRYSLVGAPASALIDPATGAFSWTTVERDGPGSYTFNVRVTDDGQPPRFDTQPVTVTVREVNNLHTVEAIADRSVNEGESLVFTVIARDEDLPPQKLSFALEPGSPPGAVIHPVSGEFSWTPTESQGPGSYRIGVRVTDDFEVPGSTTLSFLVTVREIDNAPEINPVGLQTVDELADFSLPIVARDPDSPGAALVYSLDTAPSGVSITPAGVVRWTPPESAGPGTYNVVVRVAQEGGGPVSTLGFSIVVNERNEAPVLEVIGDQSVEEGSVVGFRLSASDADLPAQRLTYRLDPGAPAEASLDPQTGMFSWPIPADVGGSTNLITVRVTDSGLDARSATRTFSVVVRPRLRLVINEILYAPKVRGTEFVEIANLSTVTAWDLGGWRLSGLAFDFPPGTVIPPGGHLAVAADLAAFRSAFGASAQAVGNARIAFTADGAQALRLMRPQGSDWETVDEVSFLRTAPWPAEAHGGGASLQLIDAAQDNRRVGNWTALLGATTNAPRSVVTFTNLWRYKQDGPAPSDWTAPGFVDASWPSGRGLLHVEDAVLPAPKNTALVRTEGRMTYYFRTSFEFTGNPDGAALVLRAIVDDGYVLHLNGREIHRLGLDPAASVTDTTAANRTVSDAVIEGPFTLPVTNLVTGRNVLAVEVHQVNTTSSDIVWGASLEVLEVKREAMTPGYANSVRARLDPFPEVWIHEVLPRNTSGITDNAGEREPWIELHNAGTVPADLAGLWLTDDLAVPRKWPLPNPAPIAPGGFRLIWADGESSEHTPDAWHAGFRLAFPRGNVALVRDQNGVPGVVDFLNYEVSAADVAYGLMDAADPWQRVVLVPPTPGAPNQVAPVNHPPVLEAVGPREVKVGAILTVDLRASDPEAGQRLTYSLVSAPEGMSVDSASGRILWTPGASQVGVHAVVVRVGDNGTPPLEVRGEFAVTVVPAVPTEVRISGIELAGGGELRITWTTTSGRRYALQHAGAPGGAAWTQLGGAFTASGSSLAATVVTQPGAQARFFRVVQLD